MRSAFVLALAASSAIASVFASDSTSGSSDASDASDTGDGGDGNVNVNSKSSRVTVDSYDAVSVSDGNGGGGNVTIDVPLKLQDDVQAGQTIKNDTELRILCIGDSITTGDKSSDANAFRNELKRNLVEDDANQVFFAGTEYAGEMEDGYFAAWAGRTIHYMSSHIQAALAQRPNVILIHAGTNDMSNNPYRSAEGNDPKGAVKRLGDLVDQVLAACPDAVVLLAVIINTCRSDARYRTAQYQGLIPAVARDRLEDGKRVLAVDMSELGDDILHEDCVHPDDDGYEAIGAAWYNFLTQVPEAWIGAPVGKDPTRPERSDLVDGVLASADDNGAASALVWPGGFGLWGVMAGVFASQVGGSVWF